MFNLDECVAFIATNSSKKVTDDFNDILKKKGSTRVQWIALYFIGRNPHITQSHLAERMNIDNSAVFRLIERLIRDELVIREKDAVDKRCIKLKLSEKGEALTDTLLPMCARFSEIICQGVSDDEIETFKKVLKTLVSNSNKNLILD